LDVVFTNGKRVKEFLADQNMTAEKMSRTLYHDQHFIICKKFRKRSLRIILYKGFKGHLTEMQKMGEIMKELRSISKPVFLKLETFLLEKIQSKLEFELMDVLLQSKENFCQRNNNF